jgi:mRNA interferase MazF
MARIVRGDVLWADLDPARRREQTGRRPVLVVSHDIFNERSDTVIAMAITSQPQMAGFPLTVELADTRLPKRSRVKVGQVRTLSVERLGKRIGRVSPEELYRVIEALNEIIASWRNEVSSLTGENVYGQMAGRRGRDEARRACPGETVIEQENPIPKSNAR